MTHKPGHFVAFCSRVTNCLSSPALLHTHSFTFAQGIVCPLPLVPLAWLISKILSRLSSEATFSCEPLAS